MFLNRINRVVFGLVLVIALVLIVPFCWNAYHVAQRNRLVDAAEQGDTATVKMLLAKGVDPNSRREAGESRKVSALERALENQHLEAMTALLDAGAKASSDALALACNRKDPAFVFAMIDHKQIAPQDALKRAIFSENVPAVESLFNRMPELKAEMDRSLMLHEAIRRNANGFFMLVRFGADVNQMDDDNLTPLMQSVISGKAGFTRVLLEAGADVRRKNSLGYDALYYARLHDQSAAERVLRDYLDPKAATEFYTAEYRAHQLYDNGKIKEAIAEYRHLLEIRPQYSPAYISLGWALMDIGQTDEAVTVCRKAVELRPSDPNAHANLGKALTLQGKLPEAMEECRTALKLSPGFAEAHYNLSLILEKNHQPSEAKAELQTYLRMAQSLPQERERVADAKKRLLKLD